MEHNHVAAPKEDMENRFFIEETSWSDGTTRWTIKDKSDRHYQLLAPINNMIVSLKDAKDWCDVFNKPKPTIVSKKIVYP